MPTTDVDNKPGVNNRSNSIASKLRAPSFQDENAIELASFTLDPACSLEDFNNSLSEATQSIKQLLNQTIVKKIKHLATAYQLTSIPNYEQFLTASHDTKQNIEQQNFPDLTKKQLKALQRVANLTFLEAQCQKETNFFLLLLNIHVGIQAALISPSYFRHSDTWNEFCLNINDSLKQQNILLPTNFEFPPVNKAITGWKYNLEAIITTVIKRAKIVLNNKNKQLLTEIAAFEAPKIEQTITKLSPQLEEQHKIYKQYCDQYEFIQKTFAGAEGPAATLLTLPDTTELDRDYIKYYQGQEAALSGNMDNDSAPSASGSGRSSAASSVADLPHDHFAEQELLHNFRQEQLLFGLTVVYTQTSGLRSSNHSRNDAVGNAVRQFESNLQAAQSISQVIHNLDQLINTLKANASRVPQSLANIPILSTVLALVLPLRHKTKIALLKSLKTSLGKIQNFDKPITDIKNNTAEHTRIKKRQDFSQFCSALLPKVKNINEKFAKKLLESFEVYCKQVQQDIAQLNQCVDALNNNFSVNAAALKIADSYFNSPQPEKITEAMQQLQQQVVVNYQYFDGYILQAATSLNKQLPSTHSYDVYLKLLAGFPIKDKSILAAFKADYNLYQQQLIEIHQKILILSVKRTTTYTEAVNQVSGLKALQEQVNQLVKNKTTLENQFKKTIQQHLNPTRASGLDLDRASIDEVMTDTLANYRYSVECLPIKNEFLSAREAIEKSLKISKAEQLEALISELATIKKEIVYINDTIENYQQTIVAQNQLLAGNNYSLAEFAQFNSKIHQLTLAQKNAEYRLLQLFNDLLIYNFPEINARFAVIPCWDQAINVDNCDDALEVARKIGEQNLSIVKKYFDEFPRDTNISAILLGSQPVKRKTSAKKKKQVRVVTVADVVLHEVEVENIIFVTKEQAEKARKEINALDNANKIQLYVEPESQQLMAQFFLRADSGLQCYTKPLIFQGGENSEFFIKYPNLRTRLQTISAEISANSLEQLAGKQQKLLGEIADCDAQIRLLQQTKQLELVSLKNKKNEKEQEIVGLQAEITNKTKEIPNTLKLAEANYQKACENEEANAKEKIDSIENIKPGIISKFTAANESLVQQKLKIEQQFSVDKSVLEHRLTLQRQQLEQSRALELKQQSEQQTSSKPSTQNIIGLLKIIGFTNLLREKTLEELQVEQTQADILALEKQKNKQLKAIENQQKDNQAKQEQEVRQLVKACRAVVVEKENRIKQLTAAYAAETARLKTTVPELSWKLEQAQKECNKITNDIDKKNKETPDAEQQAQKSALDIQLRALKEALNIANQGNIPLSTLQAAKNSDEITEVYKALQATLPIKIISTDANQKIGAPSAEKPNANDRQESNDNRQKLEEKDKPVAESPAVSDPTYPPAIENIHGSSKVVISQQLSFEQMSALLVSQATQDIKATEATLQSYNQQVVTVDERELGSYSVFPIIITTKRNTEALQNTINDYFQRNNKVHAAYSQLIQALGQPKQAVYISPKINNQYRYDMVCVDLLIDENDKEWQNKCEPVLKELSAYNHDAPIIFLLPKANQYMIYGNRNGNFGIWPLCAKIVNASYKEGASNALDNLFKNSRRQEEFILGQKISFFRVKGNDNQLLPIYEAIKNKRGHIPSSPKEFLNILKTVALDVLNNEWQFIRYLYEIYKAELNTWNSDSNQRKISLFSSELNQLQNNFQQIENIFKAEQPLQALMSLDLPALSQQFIDSHHSIEALNKKWQNIEGLYNNYRVEIDELIYCRDQRKDHSFDAELERLQKNYKEIAAILFEHEKPLTLAQWESLDITQLQVPYNQVKQYRQAKQKQTLDDLKKKLREDGLQILATCFGDDDRSRSEYTKYYDIASTKYSRFNYNTYKLESEKVYKCHEKSERVAIAALLRAYMLKTGLAANAILSYAVVTEASKFPPAEDRQKNFLEKTQDFIRKTLSPSDNSEVNELVNHWISDILCHSKDITEIIFAPEKVKQWRYPIDTENPDSSTMQLNFSLFICNIFEYLKQKNTEKHAATNALRIESEQKKQQEIEKSDNASNLGDRAEPSQKRDLFSTNSGRFATTFGSFFTNPPSREIETHNNTPQQKVADTQNLTFTASKNN